MEGDRRTQTEPTRSTRPDYPTLNPGCRWSRLRDSHSGGVVLGCVVYRAGWQFFAERLRPARRTREHLGVGRGLLARQFRGCPIGRHRLDHRKLC